MARLAYGLFLMALGSIIGLACSQGQYQAALIPALVACLLIGLDVLFE